MGSKLSMCNGKIGVGRQPGVTALLNLYGLAGQTMKRDSETQMAEAENSMARDPDIFWVP